MQYVHSVDWLLPQCSSGTKSHDTGLYTLQVVGANVSPSDAAAAVSALGEQVPSNHQLPNSPILMKLANRIASPACSCCACKGQSVASAKLLSTACVECQQCRMPSGNCNLERSMTSCCLIMPAGSALRTD